MTEAYICDAIRTPIGRYAGALAYVRADDLAAIPIKALIDRNPHVDWADLDDVILGCANQAGEDNRNLARMAALLAGLPDTSGGVTLKRGPLVRNIRLTGDEAEIEANVDRVRGLVLRTEFVKKA